MACNQDPIPPSPLPSAVKLSLTPLEVDVETNKSTPFALTVTGKNLGALRYHWTIPSNGSLLSYLDANQVLHSGLDLDTSVEKIKLEAGTSAGRLKISVEVFSIGTDNVKTKIGGAEGYANILDVQELEVTRRTETAVNLTGNVITALFWQFSERPGTKYYKIITKNNSGSGKAYLMFDTDVQSTPSTDIKYILPLTVLPPYIPIQEINGSRISDNFLRRGNLVLMLLVFGDGFNPENYFSYQMRVFSYR